MWTIYRFGKFANDFRNYLKVCSRFGKTWRGFAGVCEVEKCVHIFCSGVFGPLTGLEKVL